MNAYDEFQLQLRQHEFCIGWKENDSQVRHYYQALFDDWHEANSIAITACQPNCTPFVEAVTETIPCPRCNGTGDGDRVGKDHNCTHCHGKGRIRKP